METDVSCIVIFLRGLQEETTQVAGRDRQLELSAQTINQAVAAWLLMTTLNHITSNREMVTSLRNIVTSLKNIVNNIINENTIKLINS